MASLHWLVSQRQNGFVPQSVYFNGTRDSPYLVKRLAKTRVLEGHTGCVNSVSWNDTGTRLISGSDDCHLNIYDTATGLLHHSVHSTHQSNIFSAKFLPETGDYKVVSCAGIGSVEVSEITPYGQYVSHPFKCQTSITYQVATTPGCPHEFLTCEERGMVRIYDLRTCSSCLCDGDCTRGALCRFPAAVTSMAIHPLEPHYMVVGLGDGTIRLLDRRRADYWQDPGTIESFNPLLMGASCALVKYRPDSLKNQKLKITSVNFNPNGTQILASYSEDYVYLFNCGLYGGCPDITLTPREISRPRYYSQCERYPGVRQTRRSAGVQTKPRFTERRRSSHEAATVPCAADRDSQPTVSRGASGGDKRTSKRTPPVKRIRLRGDWSDTGPEARPENQSEPVQGGNLMNRMSRMFARWVDMSLDAVSDQGEEEGEGGGEEEEEEEGERRRRGRGRGRQSGGVGSGFGPDRSSSDSSFHLFSSDSDMDTERRVDSDVERSADTELQSGVIGERETVDGAVSDAMVQVATERAMLGAVKEAENRVIGDAMERAAEREAGREAGTAVEREAEGEIEKQHHSPNMAASLAAAFEGLPIVSPPSDSHGPHSTSDSQQLAQNRLSELQPASAMETSRPSGSLTTCESVSSRVEPAEEGDNSELSRAAERMRVGAQSSPEHVGKPRSNGVAHSKTDGAVLLPSLETRGTETAHSTSEGDCERTPSSDSNRSSSSSPHSGTSRPLVSEVRENSTPGFPSASAVDEGLHFRGVASGSPDQSRDTSHDHSYRRSRFRVQRNRGDRRGERDARGEGVRVGGGGGEGGGRKEEEREGGGGDVGMEEEEEREDRREGVREKEGCEGYWEENVEKRLMMEAMRSVQSHLQPFMVYKGHRNSRTMIKQANFWGDDWVLSGSDCGRVFVWDKWTGKVVNMFTADSHVVNCVQPHPSAYMLATSGIDYNVKLWEPTATKEASLHDVDEVMRRNEEMLRESRNTITIPSSFLLRILAYLNRSRRMRQDQSPHDDSD